MDAKNSSNRSEYFGIPDILAISHQSSTGIEMEGAGGGGGGGAGGGGGGEEGGIQKSRNFKIAQNVFK